MAHDDEKPMVGSYRPKSRRCCIATVLTLSLVTVLVICIAIPVGMNNAKKDGNGDAPAACAATEYPETCRETLAGSDGTPLGMSKASIKSSDEQVGSLSNGTSDELCKELLTDARELFARVYASMDIINQTVREETCTDIQTDLSAVLTNVNTCKDVLEESGSPEFASFLERSSKSEQCIGNTLAIVNAFCIYGDGIKNWAGLVTDLNMPGLNDLLGNGPHRRLMNAEISNSEVHEEILFPNWMDSATSRHLLTRPPSYNVIVARDGSGKYKTVGEAIKKAPQTGKKDAARYVIYVKAGVYDEQIIIPKKLTNLLIVGDGIDKTIFTGKRNVALMKGMTTFLSATMIVQGDGFIGKMFTCRNTAGAAGHQAVATRVSADKVAFYRVKFDSFQDTLYCHSFRQFYRECIVMGTVDFIFGNANAVFQTCQIVAKKTTMQGQQNTYTAQGRTDKHQNTGLAFQDCNFDGTPDLKRNVQYYPTFLGRPWKAYSVCVLLKPTIQAHVDPLGWLPWNTTNFGLYTSFFAEYKGTGPGSNRRQRVKWSHEIKDPKVANRYQAASFINGKSWITNIGMPYSLAAV